jgi:endonuclease IV
MLRLGLKIWSTNRAYRAPARALYEAGTFDFLEIAVPADSGLEDVTFWRDEPYPFVLHAPHSYSGLNMALESLETANRAQMEKLARAQAMLRPRFVIFHPGTQGSLQETVRQVRLFGREFPDLFARALVENKPRLGLRGETCQGASPVEIRSVMEATGLGLCLDVPHAIAFANGDRRPWEAVIDEFLAMGPVVYHLADGDAAAETDAHEHLGRGTFDLPRILGRIPDGSAVTVETKKDSPTDLDDFVRDVEYVRVCVR